MLQRVSNNEVNDNTCVKVYDPVEKKLIAVYENYKKAGNKLGITSSAMQHACARKKRVLSPILRMEVAPRLSARKEGDPELIEQCNKKTVLNPSLYEMFI